MMNAKIHMIGNTHIDPVWLWKRAEGMQEVKSSFSSVIERMNEFPDFKFTMSSIAYLEWVKENCAELFRIIQEKVAEGRWEIAGAMWVEPDCIIPTGESFIRHFLYSKKFVYDNFEIEPVVGYNVDSFGHGSNLPSILVGCGMKFYLFNRPGNTRLEIPPVFSWRSADGSKVIAERIGGEYLAWTKPGIEFNLRESKQMLDAYEYDRMAVFYGVGNHGGGPTIDNIRSIHELREEYHDDLDFSTLKEFFVTVDEGQLQVYQGELGRIFTGCYSSDNEIKRMNRQAEWMLIKAEAIGAMATRMRKGQYKYPKEEIEKAWKMTLFNQFHDVLSGTSIEPARNEACQEFCYAIATARNVISNGIQGIANGIDTRGDGFPLVLINPTGNVYHGVFYADVYVSSSSRKQVRIRDFKGEEIPYAESPYPYHGRDTRKGILFEAQIPAFGYSVYRVLQEGPSVNPPDNKMVVKEYQISNGIISLTIDDKTGCPSSIIINGVEMLSEPASFQVFYDDRGAWGSEYLHENLQGSFEVDQIKVVESNYLRTIIRSILHYRKSELVVDYIIEKDSDLVKMNCSIHNHEKHVEICYSVPVKGKKHQVITETALLAEKKTINDGTEFYQHRFADIIDEKDEGIAVINNCSYGMSQKGNIYRLILSRSAMFARGDDGPIEISPDVRFMDQGSWKFDLILIPHKHSITNQRLFAEADFLHMPMEYLGDNNHEGNSWLRKDQMITVSGKGVQVSSFKVAECGKQDTVLRIFECEGFDTQAKVKIIDTEIEIVLLPYEIKSFLMKENKLVECNMIEKEIV